MLIILREKEYINNLWMPLYYRPVVLQWSLKMKQSDLSTQCLQKDVILEHFHSPRLNLLLCHFSTFPFYYYYYFVPLSPPPLASILKNYPQGCVFFPALVCCCWPSVTPLTVQQWSDKAQVSGDQKQVWPEVNLPCPHLCQHDPILPLTDLGSKSLCTWFTLGYQRTKANNCSNIQYMLFKW